MFCAFFSLVKLHAIILLQCAQQRIESVQEVYQKHWSQDKVSEDGLERTSTKESIVKQANLLTINTPRRSLAPKALSFALRGANKNVGLELVKPVQNFDANNRVSGVVSKIDEAIINSPILQKDGGQYIEQKITTTTTTTTTWTRIRTGMDEIQDLGPIDVGGFHIRLFYVSLQIKFNWPEFFFLIFK